jgi:hypothetical protein
LSAFSTADLAPNLHEQPTEHVLAPALAQTPERVAPRVIDAHGHGVLGGEDLLGQVAALGLAALPGHTARILHCPQPLGRNAKDRTLSAMNTPSTTQWTVPTGINTPMMMALINNSDWQRAPIAHKLQTVNPGRL